MIYDIKDILIALVCFTIATGIFIYMIKNGIPFTFDDGEDEEDTQNER